MEKNLGKIVNGKLCFCGEKERKVITITNPSEEILKFVYNYKDVVYDEQPEFNIETQYLDMDIEEAEDIITVRWTVKDIGEVIDEKV